MNRKKGSAALAAMVTLVVGAPHAMAQDLGPFLGSPLPATADRGQNVSVAERPRPEYEPVGVKAGGFTVLPSANVGIGYSDNIFGSSTNRRGDAVIGFDPEVTLRSDWVVHALRLTGGAAIRRFVDNPIRDETGLYARVRGRIDVSRDNAIEVGGGIQRAFQPQFSSAAPTSALQPIQYVQESAYARTKRQFGRIRLSFGADFTNLDFRDVLGVNGLVFDQDYRDRSEARIAGRVEYAFSPNSAVFGEVYASSLNFDQNIVRGVSNRDGDSYNVIGGISLDLTALIRVRAGAGYTQRTFSAANVYRPIGGLAYDVRLEYFPSGLTTVTLGAIRSIEETVDVTSSGYFSSSFLGRVDHELLRSLLVFGSVQYQRNSFQGLARQDNIVSARGGGTFHISRSWALNGELGYVDRSGSGVAAAASFDEFRGTVSITYRL